MGDNPHSFKLDERGVAYVIDHLTGVNTFCTALAAVVRNVSGHCFAYAPIGTTEAQLYKFKQGGLLPENLDFSRAAEIPGYEGSFMPVEDFLDARVESTFSALTRFPWSVCIGDDYNPRWGEGIIANSKTAFGFGEEVYHLLTSKDDHETFATVIGEADTVWHGVAVICQHRPKLRVDRTVDVAELTACAESLIELTCTAYDRESFVLWRRA